MTTEVTKFAAAVSIVMTAVSPSALTEAYGGSTGGVLLARKSASGTHAHTLALAVVKPHHFAAVMVRVVAKPTQRVKAGWAKLCRGGGYVSRNSRETTHPTPIALRVTVDPNADCRIIGDATLSGGGRVTVKLYGRD